MKFLIVCFSLWLIGCGDSTNHADLVPKHKQVMVPTPLEMAKSLADSIYYYVEKSERKEISKKQVRIKADPWQRQQDSLRKYALSKAEIRELDDYRTKLVSAMVDRKIQRDRSK